MRAVTRLRAYALLWLLAGLLGGVTVFVVAAAGPTVRETEDSALRQMLVEAPMTGRDIVVSEPVVAHQTSAGIMRDTVERLLPPELAEVVDVSWGIQRTRIRQPGGNAVRSVASVTGEGIVAELSDSMPLATLHHQTGLADEITMVEGEAPRTDSGGGRETVVEVMTSVELADSLGLQVGRTYHLLPGVLARAPFPASEAEGPTVPIKVTGVFEPKDAADPVWQFDRQLVTPGVIWWVFPDGSVSPFRTATLVTDQAGIDAIVRLGLVGDGNPYGLSPESVARIRLDHELIDASQATAIRDAVAALQTDPDLRPTMQVSTGLIDLVDEFERQASSARAVTAVVVAGLVGTGVGLLVLASRVMVDRRRVEVSLLRARGGSLASLAGRFLTEAALVVVPAAAVGWLVHLQVPGRRDPALLAGVGAAPLAVAAVALLAVPVAVVLVVRHWRGVVESRGHRRVPARLTAEVLVVLLAGVGVLLLHQRGLSRAGTDPYLSAVPVLLGVAAGLVILRCYPWPLRLAGMAFTRGRSAVGYLGLARAGRAVPAAALPLLVLVLAVALGGFVGALYSSVSATRSEAALQAVGADARVTADLITQEMAATVAEQPGVREVAEVGHAGIVRAGGTWLQETAIVSVDTAAYQRILAAMEVPVRLPEAVASATPGEQPVPVLAPPSVSRRGEVTLEVAGVEVPARVVGDVADLPLPIQTDQWVLAPRQALPEPGLADELLIGGGVDADALQEALGGENGAEVTTRAGQLGELTGTGFNRSLTIALVVGTIGATLGGLLAVGMAVAVQAPPRGRMLSLLRTMGLSPGQARRLLLVELVPVTLLATAGGVAAGTVMPVLLGPALGLTSFTGGAPVVFGLNPATVALVAALVSVFVVAGALVEAAGNRRLGLGSVLRVE